MTGIIRRVAAVLCFSSAVAVAAVEVHVAPNGDDGADGSAEAPLATLARARDLLRQRGDRAGATVRVRPGVYRITETLTFGEGDGGSADAPVTYARFGEGEVRISAGLAVPAAAWKPVTDEALLERLVPAARGRVFELDLRALGVRHAQRWKDLFRGGGDLVQLYAGGERLPLARWPNEGYTTIKTVLDNGVAEGPDARGGVFVYRGDRPHRWLKAVAEGLWLDGFWRVPWFSDKIRVAAIDPSRRTIALATCRQEGIGSKYSKTVKGVRVGNGKENYVAINVFDEIDRPGEWCIRFGAGTLYLWPPNAAAGEAPADGAVILADFADRLLHARGASHLTFRGLTFEYGLGEGVRIDGGRSVRLAGCVLRRMGDYGAVVRGGRGHSVRSCDLYDLGAGGIVLGGGDRLKLIPAGHEAVNNHIHHVGQVVKTYAPAIKVGSYGVEGVGLRVANNLLHTLPHAAVLYGGNDNVLERNEVHHVAMDSHDVGAFYTWHDWTSRGNVVRHNFFHHSPEAEGVYMDDGDSGDTVVGNVFYRMRCGPFVGGGHDNIVRGNVSIACERGVHIDSRGVSRGYNLRHERLVGQVKRVRPEAPPWSTRYPAVARLLDPGYHPDWPTGTVIEGNLLLACGKAVNISGKDEHYALTEIARNVTLANAAGLFVAPRRLNFRFRNPSAVAKKIPGMEPIPFEKIGLFVDEHRRALPPEAWQRAGRRGR